MSSYPYHLCDLHITLIVLDKLYVQPKSSKKRGSEYPLALSCFYSNSVILFSVYGQEVVYRPDHKPQEVVEVYSDITLLTV